jgi:hypothetical protein
MHLGFYADKTAPMNSRISIGKHRRRPGDTLPIVYRSVEICYRNSVLRVYGINWSDLGASSGGQLNVLQQAITH